MTRRTAYRVLAALLAGAVGPVGDEAPAWAQRLNAARRAQGTLTLDLGQWSLILVRHPIYGREAYAIDPADLARALATDDGD